MLGFRSMRLSRKSPVETPKPLVPRRHTRFPLPFGASALKAQIQLAVDSEVEPVSAHLWDISDAGGCLAVQGDCTVAGSGDAVLSVCNPATRQWRRLRVELRWSSSLSQGTFVGIRFADGRLPQDIFLRDFMQRSWADAVPGGAAYS